MRYEIQNKVMEYHLAHPMMSYIECLYEVMCSKYSWILEAYPYDIRKLSLNGRRNSIQSFYKWLDVHSVVNI